MDSSIQSVVQRHLDYDAKKKARSEKIEQWTIDNVPTQYQKCKEIQKILRALKLTSVGNSLQESMMILYHRSDRNVYIGNSSMTLSAALKTWDGVDFTSSDTIECHSPDESTVPTRGHTPEPIACESQALTDSISSKFPDFFGEPTNGAAGSGSSSRKRDEPDAAVAHSTETSWVYTTPAPSTGVGTKTVRDFFNPSVQGKTLSFDDDVPEAPLPKLKKPRQLPDTVFGGSSLLGYPVAKPTSTKAQYESPDEKVLREWPAAYSKMTLPVLKLILRRYGVPYVGTTTAEVKSQCNQHMTSDRQKPERSVKDTNTDSDSSLRGITMAALFKCWSNDKKDFVFAPRETVASSDAVESTSQSTSAQAVEPESKVWSVVPSKKTLDRFKATNAEINRRAAMTPKERQDEDLKLNKEYDKMRGPWPEKIVHAPSTSQSDSGDSVPYGRLEYDDYWNYPTDASIQSQKDTFQPFIQAASPASD